MRQWKVTLTNTEAMYSVYAIALTRRQAFRKACATAGDQFLNYQVNNTYWLDGYYSCFERIRSAARVSWSNAARNMHVSIERV